MSSTYIMIPITSNDLNVVSFRTFIQIQLYKIDQQLYGFNFGVLQFLVTFRIYIQFELYIMTRFTRFETPINILFE